MTLLPLATLLTAWWGDGVEKGLEQLVLSVNPLGDLELPTPGMGKRSTRSSTLQLNPGFDDAHTMLGWVYLAQGEFRRALGEFDKARSEKESPRCLVLIAAAHAGLGENDSAFSELEKAWKCGPVLATSVPLQ